MQAMAAGNCFAARCCVLFICLGLLPGCGSAQDAGMPEYAPRSADAAIKAVSLGTSDSNNFDHSRTATSFPEGTDRVLVWYRWEGADPGTRIDNRWFKDDTVILEQGEAVTDSSGRAGWLLMMSAGSPLSTGRYRVELLEDGVLVSTIPFRIGE